MQGFTDATRSRFLVSLERRLNKQVFETWIRPLDLQCGGNGGVLRIAAPTDVATRWVKANYSQVINGVLAEMNLGTLQVEWTYLQHENAGSKSPSVGPSSQREVPSPRAHKEPGFAQVAETTTDEAALVPFIGSSLNQKYVFDAFVVASCNRLAHAAAQAVSENPGRSYNPFYLYGGVGLGKTHLIQAIGHASAQNSPSLRVAYLSLEHFMNELINAIRYGYDKTEAFRARYRTIDVLLIDDVQFIAGKERTQEEFFHTFNALYDGQKQIVLTSDCAPHEIPEIEERLHSRFEWGLITEIEPPDLETKIAILKRKAELQRIDLPDEVALLLAANSKRNIRELEGSLIRLIAIASLRGVPLSKSLAEDSIGAAAREGVDSPVSIARIQKVVADHFQVTVDSLKLRSNTRHLLEPRQVAMYLCKTLTKTSYPEIGRHFGGKHHTTVMHSVEKVGKMMASDAHFREVVGNLRDASAATKP